MEVLSTGGLDYENWEKLFFKDGDIETYAYTLISRDDMLVVVN